MCGPCLRRPPPWDRAVAALAYAFPADRIVCRFKFNRDFACGRLLGLELLTAVRSSGAQLPELIVPAAPAPRPGWMPVTASAISGAHSGVIMLPIRFRLMRVLRS